ncbi:hypothetical protein EVAR_52921_1 [Eumeta japonica]|uniref:Uncharacterized protein n=1 Tax=Eumeta variegata TaxID=151549 RepID=A0A4C1Y7C2_EUMVA|nr:hypothetical protein EVAR_52921_1 [Eumeta japonica]
MCEKPTFRTALVVEEEARGCWTTAEQMRLSLESREAHETVFRLGRRPAALGLRGSRPPPRACVSICRDALLCAVRRSGKIVRKTAATGGRQLAVLRARVI